jgi:hypothetical protein
MATKTFIRTASSSQIGSLLTQASASTTYLSKVEAASNYLTKASASTTYLSQASASTTYLSQASASSSYAPITPLTQTGFRNVIINGDFKICQRFPTTVGAVGGIGSTYAFDRWRWVRGAPLTNWNRAIFTPGNAIPGHEGTAFSSMAINTGGTTNDTVYMEQKIEDVRTFAGQTVTLSFWAKASTGTPKIAVMFSQNFGTGGSPSTQVYSYASQVTLSTSWDRYSVTYTVPSIAGKTIGTTDNTSYLSLYLFYAAGSSYDSLTGSMGWQSGTFDLWGVQLEKGSTATPFEQRPIGTELALCQRYYCSSVSNDSNYFHNSYLASPNSGFNEAVPVAFPTRMRIVPTLSVSFTNYDNATNGGQAITVDGFEQYFRCGTAAFPYAGWRASYTATAEL